VGAVLGGSGRKRTSARLSGRAAALDCRSSGRAGSAQASRRGSAPLYKRLPVAATPAHCPTRVSAPLGSGPPACIGIGPCPIPVHTLAPATQPGCAAPQAVEGQLVTAISFVKTLASNHQQELNLLRCKVRGPGRRSARPAARARHSAECRGAGDIAGPVTRWRCGAGDTLCLSLRPRPRAYTSYALSLCAPRRRMAASLLRSAEGAVARGHAQVNQHQLQGSDLGAPPPPAIRSRMCVCVCHVSSGATA